MKTTVTKTTDIKRDWHLIDLNGQILGRAATQIAQLLIGKDKPYFTSNLDCGDYVIVINSEKVFVTGRKAKQKMYYSHSQFPGGLKELNYSQMMQKDPTRIIIHAVNNMLPKNKLRSERLKRLRVFVGTEHPYSDKLNK